MAQLVLQRFGRDYHDGYVVERGHGGGARAAGQKAHFAEDLARADVPHDALLALDVAVHFAVAARHQEGCVGGVTWAETWPGLLALAGLLALLGSLALREMRRTAR